MAAPGSGGTGSLAGNALLVLASLVSICVACGCAFHPAVSVTDPLDLAVTETERLEPAVVTSKIVPKGAGVWTGEGDEFLDEFVVQIEAEAPKKCKTVTYPDHKVITKRKIEKAGYALIAAYAATTAGGFAFGSICISQSVPAETVAPAPGQCSEGRAQALGIGIISAALFTANVVTLIKAATAKEEVELVPTHSDTECTPCRTWGRDVYWDCEGSRSFLGKLNSEGRLFVNPQDLLTKCPNAVTGFDDVKMNLSSTVYQVEIDWLGCWAPTRKRISEIVQQFKGKTNTTEVLIGKAKALAPSLVGMAVENTRSLFEKLSEVTQPTIDDQKLGKVFFEAMLFYLHLVDRITLQHLGAEKSKVFMETLFVEAKDVVSRMHESGIDAGQFRSALLETYHQRQAEYGKYGFPEKDEGAEDPLFQEFGRKVVGIIGIMGRRDFAAVRNVHENVHEYVEYSTVALELSELFQE